MGLDTRGHILKLDVLINECSQYTNAKTARDNPARTKHCSQALGPNQPGITDVATVDRRHFGVVRPAHADGFTLLP